MWPWQAGFVVDSKQYGLSRLALRKTKRSPFSCTTRVAVENDVQFSHELGQARASHTIQQGQYWVYWGVLGVLGLLGVLGCTECAGRSGCIGVYWVYWVYWVNLTDPLTCVCFYV